MSPSEKAEALLETILLRCTAARLPVGEVLHRQWNVEAAVGEGPAAVKVLVYFNAKGTLTPKIQGKKSPLRDLVELQLYGDEIPGSPFLPADVCNWIGVDESGKGDYFGPLVAAAVEVSADSLLQLQTLILRDSKELGAERITRAAKDIRRICEGKFSIVTVLPERYNTFMEGTSFGKNSQRILAWMHARCIEDLLGQGGAARHAVCDKFANDAVIRRALMTHGRSITVHQHVRAEADPAVAAAAILARDEFTRRIAQLSKQAGCRLPLGASDERGIFLAARHIMKTEGMTALRSYAKLHFRTTQKMLAELKRAEE
ncbi:MAG: ribonuclease HIII [Bacteroidetes bacterium]|nr:ribonuclease HIII [Bacteroidota bacterium]